MYINCQVIIISVHVSILMHLCPPHRLLPVQLQGQDWQSQPWPPALSWWRVVRVHQTLTCIWQHQSHLIRMSICTTTWPARYPLCRASTRDPCLPDDRTMAQLLGSSLEPRTTIAHFPMDGSLRRVRVHCHGNPPRLGTATPQSRWRLSPPPAPPQSLGQSPPSWPRPPLAHAPPFPSPTPPPSTAPSFRTRPPVSECKGQRSTLSLLPLTQ